MEIFRIATSRNTSYSLGESYNTGFGYMKAVKISWSLEDGCFVLLENGVIIGVNDPVEFWKRDTSKEYIEKKILSIKDELDKIKFDNSEPANIKRLCLEEQLKHFIRNIEQFENE